ncbi:MarR family winged helix-turn-helix transcriptional regulator [Paenibacillus spongiae]|uniref:MarR family transcriptional regulator n=1 Tax=Paenibacillus spongiae TaxID=2909671 RepID=A0ABY5SE21_9BACL|nr:MarR family transcriptional regulator [Paenibacillus spongiae]UVI30765.1 MarR family transcriptional regulator [Paenibacillus spongiae]
MQVNAQLVELPALFKSLVKKMTHEWNCKVEDQLSMTQFRMLYLLKVAGLSKPHELAESLGVTPGAITGIVDKMIQKGYIVRHRDSEDRRVVRLAITEAGEQYIEILIEKRKQVISNFFNRLPEEDVEHLRRILTTLLEQVHDKEEL